jgi:hypothetical protein
MLVEGKRADDNQVRRESLDYTNMILGVTAFIT